LSRGPFEATDERHEIGQVRAAAGIAPGSMPATRMRTSSPCVWAAPRSLRWPVRGPILRGV